MAVPDDDDFRTPTQESSKVDILWVKVRDIRDKVGGLEKLLTRIHNIQIELAGNSGKNGRVGELKEDMSKIETTVIRMEKAQTAIAVKVGLVMSVFTSVAVALIIWALKGS